MSDSTSDTDRDRDRDPIVSEGRYAVIADGEDEGVDYRLVVEGHEDGHGVPIDRTELDDAATVLSRLRNAETDPEDTATETAGGVELDCHECGKTWTYTGDDKHAACPTCETEVPVEGIGP